MATERTGSADHRWSTATDGELAAALVGHQAEALREAVRRHERRVVATATRVSAARASDVAQEIFLDLWRRPHRFDPARGSLCGFLVLQARTRSLDGVRADTSRRKREESNHRTSHATAPVDDVMIQRHDADRVRKALADLPETEREAVVLAFFGGHPYREVARILDIPEGTIKSRIRTGLRHLRAQLSSAEPALVAV